MSKNLDEILRRVDWAVGKGKPELSPVANFINTVSDHNPEVGSGIHLGMEFARMRPEEAKRLLEQTPSHIVEAGQHLINSWPHYDVEGNDGIGEPEREAE